MEQTSCKDVLLECMWELCSALHRSLGPRTSLELFLLIVKNGTVLMDVHEVKDL